MKKNLLIILVFFAFSFVAYSQKAIEVISLDKNQPEKHGFLGIGFAMGFFNPGDVNEYLKYKYSGMVSQSGFTEMYMNLDIFTNIAYRLDEYIELQGILEAAFGPKLVSMDGDMEFYDFMRISPGGLLNFHIPVGESNSIFLGGGLTYNFMSFETYSAGAVGYRIQAGYSFNISTHYLALLASWDGIKGKTGHHKSMNNSEMELDYSGVRLGANILFPSFY